MVTFKPQTFNKLRFMTVGFDNIFNHFEELMDNDFNVNYPFYNIKQSKDNSNVFKIEMALAGYAKDDITVDYENNILTVMSTMKDKEDQDKVYHQGISKRNFNKSFTIAEDVEVHGADFTDGLLTITLKRVLPEHKQKRSIKIK